MVILYYSLRLANSEALVISTPRIGLLDPPSAYHGKETNSSCFCQPSLSAYPHSRLPAQICQACFISQEGANWSLCVFNFESAQILIFLSICVLCKFLMTWSNLKLSTLMSAEIQYIPLLPTTHTHTYTQKTTTTKLFKGWFASLTQVWCSMAKRQFSYCQFIVAHFSYIFWHSDYKDCPICSCLTTINHHRTICKNLLLSHPKLTMQTWNMLHSSCTC